MKNTSILLGLVAIVPVLAIPPPDFGFPEAPNHTELSITYRDNGNTIVVQEADLFGVGIADEEPIVAVETANYESISSYNGSYVLLMVDPDARFPENPTLRFILHWLQTNVTAGPVGADGTSPLINNTAARVPYRGPGPPTNSSAHRYIFYAFQQHDNFTFPAAFESFNATNRAMFNLTAFLDESNLGQVPAAAQYFFASNMTGVPQDFSAAAGGTFPGGNGQMITEGPGPAITASATTTGSGSAAATSGSGSGTASATGSAASASGSNAASVVDASTGSLFVVLLAFLNLF
ncbi:hypothetical protein LTR84_007116 [Exophiala bonariae]|uniref:PEBP-like protein n=1 Tax=Exophiala bonariae TaxID=1690606 RepID=A0AAV9MZQ1_9EURO|nr:hypothetical protein LTR84_007116 [Exophiala bonariae]